MDAFEELVRRYEHRVYGFALRSTGSPADAAELTQDVFVKVYQAISAYDPSREFGPWLFTIARRKVIDRHRASRPELAEMPELLQADDPAEQLARREEGSLLWQLARRQLSCDQFHALWLRYVEEMDVREIARVLQKTSPHVKVLLFRARKKLLRHFATQNARTTTTSPRLSPQPIGLPLPGPEQPL